MREPLTERVARASVTALRLHAKQAADVELRWGKRLFALFYVYTAYSSNALNPRCRDQSRVVSHRLILFKHANPSACASLQGYGVALWLSGQT